MLSHATRRAPKRRPQHHLQPRPAEIAAAVSSPQAFPEHADLPYVSAVSSRTEPPSPPPRLLAVVIDSSNTETRRCPSSSPVMLRWPFNHNDLSNTLAHARSCCPATRFARPLALAAAALHTELRPPRNSPSPPLHATPAPPEATNGSASLRRFQRARPRNLLSPELARRATPPCPD